MNQCGDYVSVMQHQGNSGNCATMHPPQTALRRHCRIALNIIPLYGPRLGAYGSYRLNHMQLRSTMRTTPRSMPPTTLCWHYSSQAILQGRLSHRPANSNNASMPAISRAGLWPVVGLPTSLRQGERREPANCWPSGVAGQAGQRSGRWEPGSCWPFGFAEQLDGQTR